MATFDFRVLLETVEGNKTSYMSQSFVDTSQDLVLSASQVYHRITGSVSCSYQNSSFFSGSDFNTSKTFKDNRLLSASLHGGLITGSIDFDTTDDEYDRLLRYKFFGEKVCNVLGLPNGQWIYVDQVRFPVDDESNVFQGNVEAGNVFIADTLDFANNANINSDIPFLIDTGSDRHIKFIDQRDFSTLGLIMGYDKNLDVYEISGSNSLNFNIGGVDNLKFSDGTTQTTAGGGSGTPGGSNTHVQFNDGGSFGGEAVFQYNKSTDTLTAPTVSVTDDLLVSQDIIHILDDDTKIRFSADNVAISAGGGDVTNFEPGGINTAGHITASGNISASGDAIIGGTITSNDFTAFRMKNQADFLAKDSSGTYKTIMELGNDDRLRLSHVDLKGTVINTNITASGEISASGKLYALGADFADQNIVNIGSVIADSFAADAQPTDNTITFGTDKVTFLNGGKLTVINNGHITASGNISSSGTTTTKNLTVTTIMLSNRIDRVDNAKTGVEFNDGIKVSGGHITASGNISSSGDIKASTFTAVGNVDFNGDLDVDGTTNLDDTNMAGDVTITSREVQIIPHGGSALVDPPALFTINGDLDVRSHITASGNISASSGFIGNSYTIGTQNLGTFISSDTIMSLASSNKKTQINGTNIKLDGPVTASGDISASGILDASGVTDGLAAAIVAEIDNDEISGDKIEGGTIGSVTITDLTATTLNVTHFTSSFITSSTIQTEGSNIFGDTIADTHLFNGHITASGNISASGHISSSGIRSNDKIEINTPFAQLKLSDDGFNDFLAIGQSGAVGYIKTSDADNNFKIRRGSDNTDLFSIDFSDEGFLLSGSVTASGNISSSGKLFAYGADFADQNIVNIGSVIADSFVYDAQPTDNTITFGTDKVTFLNGGKLTVINNGHITASGNISSSGTVYATQVNIAAGLTSLTDGQLYLDGDGDDLTIKTGTNGISDNQPFLSSVGSLSVLLDSANGSTTDYFNIKKNSSNPNSATEIFRVNEEGSVVITNHITASGNISSSDGFIGNSYTIGTQNLGTFISSDTIMSLASANKKTQINGKNIKLDGPVTASGDISASGIVYGSQGYFESDNGTLLTLERNDSQNAAIVYKNTQGTMVAGIDNDAHNDGANVFGIGYVGDIIDSDGSDNATFVVTGSQVVINNSTTASKDSALTVEGNISIPTGKLYGNKAYNNYLNFNNSSSLFVIQNKTYVKFDGSNNQREVTVNEGTNDIDFVVKGKNNVGSGNPLFHTDAATHKIGMHGVGGPEAGLHLADNLFVSGSTLTSEGHITASGQISSSGKLFAYGADFADQNIVNIGSVIADSFVCDADVSTNIVLTSGTATFNQAGIVGTTANFSSNITASGNISASGDIQLENTKGIQIRTAGGTLGDLITLDSDDDVIIGNGSFDKIKFVTDNVNPAVLIDGSGNVGIGTSNPTKKLQVTGDISSSGAINTLSHITASGNISASSGFIGDSYTIGTQNLGTFISSDTIMSIASSNKKTQINGTNIKLDGPVTASGDISSSGTITGNALSVTTFNPTNLSTGNITASGNISSSGTGTNYFGGDVNVSGSVVLQGSGINITNDSATELNFNGTGNTNITTAGNMYIKAASTKKMYFGAGGVDEQVTIDTSGWVGIGDTSPNAPLDIESSNNVLARFTSTGDDSKIIIEDDDTIGYHNVRDNYHSFGFDGYTTRSPLFVVSGSLTNGVWGKVGIGTTTPSKTLTVTGDISASGALMGVTNITASNRLTVGGVANFNGSFVNIGGGFGSTGVSIADDGDIQTDGHLTVGGHITASGEISASGKLFAYGADFADQNIVNIGQVIADSFAYDAQPTDNTITFGTDKVTFLNGGKLTVINQGHITASGDISASGNLILGSGTIEGTDLNIDVSSTLNLQRGGATYAQITSGKFLIKDDREIAFGNGSDYSMGYKSSDDTFRLVDGADVDSNARMVVNSSGNFGIGTTNPSEKLQVNGNIAISGSNASLQLKEGTGEAYKFTANGTDLEMQVDGTAAMTIHQSRNIGIGTTSPTKALQVAGDISSSGAISTESHITASGNISSSGDVKGSTLTGTLQTAAQSNITSLGTLTTLTVDDITLNASKISDSGNLEIEAGGHLTLDVTGDTTIDSNGDIVIDANGGDVFFKDDGTTSIRFNVADGHITASGDISASGTITANSVDINGGTIDGVVIGGNSAGAGTFTTLNATSLNVTSITSSIVTSSILQTEGSNIFGDAITDTQTFNGHITASGNISASGTIVANEGAIWGDITAVGNINAYGNIVGDNNTNISQVNDITTLGDSSFGNATGDTHKFLGDITASGDISASGEIKTRKIQFPEPSAETTNGIFFYDTSSNAPNTKVNVIQWDFSNDDAYIYANQSSSDATYMVNELRDNNTTDKFVWWFNNWQGKTTDSFPLMLEGNKAVINYYYDRRTTFHRDSNATNGASNNVDFYLLKSGSTAVNVSNSLIFGDVSDSQVTINGDITASGNISSSGTGDNYFGGTVYVGADDSYLDNDTLFLKNTGDHVSLNAGISGISDGQAFISSLGSLSILLDNDNSSTTDYFNIKKNTAAPNSATEIFRVNEEGSVVITNHITASGQISSSGKLFAYGADFDDQNIVNIGSVIADSFASDAQPTDNTITFGTDKVTFLNGGKLTVINNGHITASGNISSSGDIYSANHYFTNSNTDDFLGYSAAYDAVYIQSADINLNAPGSGVGINQSVSYNNTATLDVNGNIFTNSHITASENISSSGDFFGTSYNIEGQNLGSLISSDTIMSLASANKKTQINGTNINLNAPVTASGNISASGGSFTGNFPDTNDDAEHPILVTSALNGTIESQNSLKVNPSTNQTTVFGNLQVNTNITASGDISSSGNIIGNMYQPTFHNFDATSTSEVYIPFPTSTTDSTGTSYIREWLAPFDGSLSKIRFIGETAARNTTFKLYVNAVIAGGATATSDTVNAGVADTTYNFTFDETAAVFSAGDLIRVTMDPLIAPDNVNVTMIWNYNTNTL